MIGNSVQGPNKFVSPQVGANDVKISFSGISEIQDDNRGSVQQKKGEMELRASPFSRQSIDP